MADTITLSAQAEARVQFWSAPDDAMFPATVIAPVLDLSESTMAKMRCDGTGPAHSRRGHQRYYRKADVVAWMRG